MKTKEELVKEFINKEFDCKACEYMGACKFGNGYDSAELYDCNAERHAEYFQEGWDTAIKNQWTIPDCRDNVPDPKIVLKKGIIALLSNGRIIYQKDMRGFYWMPEDNKLVNYYSDVIAWMYAPSVDEFVKRKE